MTAYNSQLEQIGKILYRNIPFLYDLHLHSHFSDGKYSPHESLIKAKEVGLKAVAFTEHNFVGNADQYLPFAKENNIQIIPAVEISTMHNGKSYHLLGYFKEFPHQDINNGFKDLIKGYETRAQKIVDQCQKAGIDISYQELRDTHKEAYISTYTIAEAVQHALKLKTIEETFSYARSKNLFWVKDEFRFPDTVDMIGYIKEYKGISVIAHPGSFFWFNEERDWNQQVNSLFSGLENFVVAGLQGIETYYCNHPLIAIQFLEEFCIKNNLLKTGGSDWHGIERSPDHLLGSGGVNKNQFLLLKQALER